MGRTDRLILRDYEALCNHGPMRVIVVGIIDSETPRLYKLDRVVVLTYLHGKLKYRGQDTYCFKKPVSISKKNPEVLACIDERSINQLRAEACLGSITTFLMKTVRNVPGKVVYFDRRTGEGMINIQVGQDRTLIPVYACNLAGRKTWYPETACVYLEDGQEVIVDSLCEVAGGLTPKISQGVKFDSEKWNSLDQDRLAFRVRDDGSTTGLFSQK